MNADVLQAEERLIRAALRVLMAERRLADPDGSVVDLADASDALKSAAKWLAAVEKLHQADWVESPLVNPGACGKGDCDSCDGPPCEHKCHVKDGAS